jgi:hypothetical protein
MSSYIGGRDSSDIRKDISNHCFILGIPDLQRSQYDVDAIELATEKRVQQRQVD